MGTQSWTQDDPKCPESAKKKPKSSLLGAKSVAFTCEICESGPLLKHQQGLCFHHIMKVRAPPFLLRNSLRERTAHRERFFSHFWLYFWRPSRTQGRPRESKGIPKPPPGRLKSIRNRPGTPPGYSRELGRLQGYPRDGKMTLKSTNKQ